MVKHTAVIDRIHKFMKKLTSVKGRAVLLKMTKLHPKLNNVTRWLSTYKMVGRFLKLHPLVEKIEFKDLEKIDLVALFFIAQDVAHGDTLFKSL